MDLKIIVRIKQVYGNELIYPVCKFACAFAELTGKKTLSRSDLAHIKYLGYTVELEAQTL